VKVPGAVDLALEGNRGTLQLRISADREQLARDGMNADDVLTAVSTGIGNKPVSTLIEGVKRFGITAHLGPDVSAFIKAIRNIPIHTASSAIIPLSKVAKVSANEGYSFIHRKRLQRYSVIQMDVAAAT
jgi:cobalt-zinc-cadmium resistance protein CzcA